MKNQAEILSKLGIAQLNPMQEAAQAAFASEDEILLLSPTGTGKTLAFLLPLIASLDPEIDEVQALILAPSRELAMQIETVAKEMGTGFKTNVVYGGRPISKDKIDLRKPPALLIGTPGRIADHLRRETVSSWKIKTLVLDEFDKALEIGFELDMTEIMESLPSLKKKVLTSATQGMRVPEFVGLRRPVKLNFLDTGKAELTVKSVVSPSKDKLETLEALLCHLGNRPGIVFCNFRDSIERVSEFLEERGIDHGCFHGGMEQQDRERSLIKFRNGSHQLLLATDLAARGIDVPEIQFIVHYHLPVNAHEFTHRNGRTARMNRQGSAYVIHWEEEALPDFIGDPEIEAVQSAELPSPPAWTTVLVSGGRRDKISKGDLAGLFFKQGELGKDQLGVIELKPDCAFVAVDRSMVNEIVKRLDNSRIKKRKVRVKIV